MALRTERGGGKKGKGRCLTNCLFLCAALDYSCALLTNLTRPACSDTSKSLRRDPEPADKRHKTNAVRIKGILCRFHGHTIAHACNSLSRRVESGQCTKRRSALNGHMKETAESVSPHRLPRLF